MSRSATLSWVWRQALSLELSISTPDPLVLPLSTMEPAMPAAAAVATAALLPGCTPASAWAWATCWRWARFSPISRGSSNSPLSGHRASQTRSNCSAWASNWASSAAEALSLTRGRAPSKRLTICTISRCFWLALPGQASSQ
ncbi:hypothetical protein D3C76_1139940 [compost metagenome]